MPNTYQFQTIRSSLSTQSLLLSGEEWKEMKEAEIPKLVFDSGTKLEGGKLFAASRSQETYRKSGMGDEKRYCFNLIGRHLLPRKQFQFPSFITIFPYQCKLFTSPRPKAPLQTDCEFKMKQSSSTAELLVFQYCVSEHAKKYF